MGKRISLLWAVLVLIIPLMAQDMPELIEKAGDKEDYPEAHRLVVFDSIKVDVEESGLSHVNTHRLYKILDKTGAKNTRVIQKRYDPLSAHLEIKNVKIHRKDGRVIELGEDKIFDYPKPARMIYWGARKKMIEVGRLEPGDAVELSFYRKGFTYALLRGDQDEKYIPPMKGHFYDIVRFFGSNPIKEMVYRVDVPKDKPMQYEFYNGSVQVASRFLDGKIRYRFTKEDIMPIKREPHMVAMDNVGPKLLMSTSPDWEAKSKWFYGVNEDYGSFESNEAIDQKVDEILKDANSEMDSISQLTHWVADNIRYSGLSMGEGEGYTLHKGSMTFEDRCGVCKDKAGMLVTMLRAAGFESYAAMTMAGSRIEDIPADQFNHSVTLVRLSNGELKLLDPTWVPFVRELWSSAEQQQNYLPGLPDGADLKKTPISPPENHYVKMKINGSLNKKGDLTGKFYITAEGQSDAAIRRDFVRSFRREWDRKIKKEMMKIHPDIKFEDMQYSNPYEYQKGPIEITVDFAIPSYAFKTQKGLIYSPVCGKGAFKSAMAHLNFNTSLEERDYAFRDRCSREVNITEKISLPANVDVELTTKNAENQGEITSFKGDIDVQNRKLIIDLHGKFGKRVYKAEEWPEFRAAVKSHKKISRSPIIIKF